MKRRQVTEGGAPGGRGTLALAESLADQIQDEDRMRLLEPTSLPKILRGPRHSIRANTAVLSRIALEAFKAKLWAEGREVTDEEATRLFRGGADRASSPNKKNRIEGL